MILLAMLPPILALTLPPLVRWWKQKPVPVAAPATTMQPAPVVYVIGSTDPDLAFTTVTTLLAGTPNTRISLDRNTGALWVTAPPPVHKTVQAIIRELQKNQ
jgi:hypothetical protein